MNKHAWTTVAGLAVAVLIVAGCGPAASSSAPPAPSSSASPASSGGGQAGISAAPGAASTPAAAPAQPAQPTQQASVAPATEFTVCMLPVVSCDGEMRTEPATIEVSGDGSGFVAGITWSGWGTGTAQGAGTLNVNNCTPNCAQGKLTGYPATIRLSGLTPYGNGLQAYADMTISAPGDSYNQSYFHLLP